MRFRLFKFQHYIVLGGGLGVPMLRMKWMKSWPAVNGEVDFEKCITFAI